jgi:hypothetical protein
MVGRWLFQRQLEERFERDPVIDLAFQFWIGFDLKPFLEQEAFEQQQWRICFFTFFGLACLIILQQEILNGLPIDNRFNLAEENVVPIFIGVGLNSHVSK